MCLSIPAQVVELQDQQAIVSVQGVRQKVSTILVPDIAVDDYVLIHVGYALQKMDQDEAQKTLDLFQSLES